MNHYGNAVVNHSALRQKFTESFIGPRCVSWLLLLRCMLLHGCLADLTHGFTGNFFFTPLVRRALDHHCTCYCISVPTLKHRGPLHCPLILEQAYLTQVTATTCNTRGYFPPLAVPRTAAAQQQQQRQQHSKRRALLRHTTALILNCYCDSRSCCSARVINFC